MSVSNDNSRTFVKLAYFDKINSETIKKVYPDVEYLLSNEKIIIPFDE